MKTLTLLSVGTLLSVQAAYQAVVMDPQKRIESPVSALSFNRLSVEGDTIHQVFGNGDLSVDHDETGVHVFVKPIHAHPQTLYLTLVTAQGRVQDLTFQVRQDPTPTTLVLTPQREKGRQKPPLDRRHQVLRQAMRSLVAGRPLDGFVKDTALAVPKTLGVFTVTQRVVWVSAGLQAEHWTVTNATAESQALTPSLMGSEGLKAVVITNQTLKSQESSQVYVLRTRLMSLQETAHESS